MKTILLAIIVLFSFDNINGQETTSIEPVKELSETKRSTKVDFFETLIAVNNFDIKIKKEDKVAIKTKSDFYRELMKKNGFTTKETQLADTLKKNKKEINIADTTQLADF